MSPSPIGSSFGLGPCQFELSQINTRIRCDSEILSWADVLENIRLEKAFLAKKFRLLGP